MNKKNCKRYFSSSSVARPARETTETTVARPVTEKVWPCFLPLPSPSPPPSLVIAVFLRELIRRPQNISPFLPINRNRRVVAYFLDSPTLGSRTLMSLLRRFGSIFHLSLHLIISPPPPPSAIICPYNFLSLCFQRHHFLPRLPPSHSS